MATGAVEKTEEELRKEIDELQRQQREITERLRDPRGLRRGGLTGPGPQNGGRGQRGIVRSADRTDTQLALKPRLSSAVVKCKKLEDGEIVEEASDHPISNNVAHKEVDVPEGGANLTPTGSERNPAKWPRRENNQRPSRTDMEIPQAEYVPRVLPQNDDPSLVNRNKRMLGQLLGTLERFRKEDKQLSGSEAYMRRSDSLKRAEQRAREESEKLRQQERETIAKKRRKDLTLRARVAAKAEEKKLELLFLRWSEHHRKLGNFIRTKAKPHIYYAFSKPLDENVESNAEQKEQVFLEWKQARREELYQYQKQISEQYIANVEKELERWQNGRKGRKPNSDVANLQETMDKELETHRLEHGPKSRKIPGGADNEDEEDMEDINVGEDDIMMDDVLDADENSRKIDEATKAETGEGSPRPENEPPKDS